MKKIKKLKLISKILIILDIIIIGCFVLTYSPFIAFRDFVITTAMTTKSHKYIARTFYSEKLINKVLSENYVTSFKEDTDASQVKVGDISNHYSSVYEKQILERDKDDLYKLIEFKYNGYNVFLTAIYDPSRVKVASTEYLGYSGEFLTSIARKNSAKVAINAGGFVDTNYAGNGGMPIGIVIENGKIRSGVGGGAGQIAGFNKDNVLVLTTSTAEDAINKGIRDAIQFGPFLIVNGKSATVYGNGGGGIHPRTVLAQRKDGIVLFLVIDGHGQDNCSLSFSYRGGVDYRGIIEILERYGAYNAVNMDGGASTTLVVEGSLYNKPCACSNTGERMLPNGWIVQ